MSCRSPLHDARHGGSGGFRCANQGAASVIDYGLPRDVNNILIVRLGAMGDILHALPAATALRRSFPAARLVWAVEAKWAPLLERNGVVDEVVLIERRRPSTWTATRRAQTDGRLKQGE